MGYQLVQECVELEGGPTGDARGDKADQDATVRILSRLKSDPFALPALIQALGHVTGRKRQEFLGCISSAAEAVTPEYSGIILSDALRAFENAFGVDDMTLESIPSQPVRHTTRDWQMVTALRALQYLEYGEGVEGSALEGASDDQAFWAFLDSFESPRLYALKEELKNTDSVTILRCLLVAFPDDCHRIVSIVKGIFGDTDNSCIQFLACVLILDSVELGNVLKRLLNAPTEEEQTFGARIYATCNAIRHFHYNVQIEIDDVDNLDAFSIVTSATYGGMDYFQYAECQGKALPKCLWSPGSNDSFGARLLMQALPHMAHKDVKALLPWLLKTGHASQILPTSLAAVASLDKIIDRLKIGPEAYLTDALSQLALTPDYDRQLASTLLSKFELPGFAILTDRFGRNHPLVTALFADVWERARSGHITPWEAFHILSTIIVIRDDLSFKDFGSTLYKVAKPAYDDLLATIRTKVSVEGYDPEDLLQDGLLRFSRRLGTIAPYVRKSADTPRYLRRIMLQDVWQSLKHAIKSNKLWNGRLKRIPFFNGDGSPFQHPAYVDREIDRREFYRTLDAALMDLSECERELFRMIHIDQMRNKDIAGKLLVTPCNITNRTKALYEKLSRHPKLRVYSDNSFNKRS
ncbi:sigma-70 family RNA polymerase sigma factor [Pirellulales bacterium]|nr:sigma-70 family RNA polymerase sigma factor [Pirellulales bacterium]